MFYFFNFKDFTLLVFWKKSWMVLKVYFITSVNYTWVSLPTENACQTYF